MRKEGGMKHENDQNYLPLFLTRIFFLNGGLSMCLLIIYKLANFPTPR